jgi:RecA-family ATPase
LKPRRDANGADTSRIRYARELFTLDENGIALLRAEIEESRPDLVVIDPIVAFLDSGSDLNDAADMTRFLTELDKVAREFDCALLVVRHLRKLRDGSAINQGLGSIALSGRVRSILLIARHPSDPSLRAVAHSKSNYAAQGPTIVFSFEPTDNEQPRVEWQDVDENISAHDLLTANIGDPGRPPKELHDAMDVLRALLSGGPKSSQEIKLAIEARGVSTATLRRARSEMKLRQQRNGRQVLWSLPEPSIEAA